MLSGKGVFLDFSGPGHKMISRMEQGIPQGLRQAKSSLKDSYFHPGLFIPERNGDSLKD